MSQDDSDTAPGAPGILPTWSSSAKDMIGTGLGPARLWFTVGYGIVNEVYFPRVDLPQIRDLGFIVADGQGFWCEVKRLGTHVMTTPEPGIPAVEITHTHERFRLVQRIAPDPERDVLLIEVALEGDEALAPYALISPHLGGSGHDNRALVYTERGRTVLGAEQGPFGLALAAADESQSDAWLAASAGHVGSSDGWQDFHANGAMTWRWRNAGPGNVALMGALPRRATLALAFAGSTSSAATLAISALIQDFDTVWNDHVALWRGWHPAPDIGASLSAALRDQLRLSAMVLRAHQDKTYPGAMVASLSIPWGNAKDDIGGYHLVWPRDLVESALALVTLGALEDARDILRYLIATQLIDGRWQQNQWLGGTPNWHGVQLDEVGWPVILAAALAERDALGDIEAADMVRRALGFIVRNGPATDQDRWEEIAGINPFTLAVCIAALAAGAEMLATPLDGLARDVADDWAAHVEDWTAAAGGTLAARFAVARHYVRTAPVRVLEDPAAMGDAIELRNIGPDRTIAASALVSTDFLQLVRFGIRPAGHDVVRDTIAVIDGVLKVDTPNGPAWHRYNEDGYGERADGSAFLGVGIGRPWPLLTGERGHYALCAGEDALPYLEAMNRMSGRGKLIPEQVWDTRRAAGEVPVPRPADRLGHAARLGARRVRQAGGVARGRRAGRPAGGGRPALRRCARAAVGALVAAGTRRPHAGRVRPPRPGRRAGDPALVDRRLDDGRGYRDPLVRLRAAPGADSGAAPAVRHHARLHPARPRHRRVGGAGLCRKGGGLSGSFCRRSRGVTASGEACADRRWRR